MKDFFLHSAQMMLGGLMKSKGVLRRRNKNAVVTEPQVRVNPATGGIVSFKRSQLIGKVITHQKRNYTIVEDAGFIAKAKHPFHYRVVPTKPVKKQTKYGRETVSPQKERVGSENQGELQE